ncbi:MAG: hypothetical protein WCL14_02470 [Bacteroidota bacterium]
MKLQLSKIISLILFSVILNQLSYANLNKKDSIENSKSNENFERAFTISLDYGSNQSYKGRKASDRQPYYIPNFTYQAPSGFFFYFAATNVTSVKGDTSESAKQANLYGIDLLQFNPGYNFKIGKKTDASVSYSRYVVKDTSIINGNIKNNLDLYLNHDFGFINGKVILDYDFDFSSGEKDLSFGIEGYHSFNIDNIFTADNDELSIIPSALITTGTQNFYAVKKGRKGKGTTTSTTTFGILAIDFTLPISYNIGDFTIEPAINYTFPLSQLPGEKTKPFGYFTVALSYDF